MKRTVMSFVLTIALLITAAASAQAKDMKMDHSGMEGKMASHAGMGDHKAMDGGMEIHTSMVNGYHLTYKLIDMAEKMASMSSMKNMKAMPEMKNSHHLMVFVTDSAGEAVETAKVGYVVKGPDGNSQKCMAMGMLKGFGADVNLKEKGSYTIITKAKFGDEMLKDKFVYEMK